MSRIGKQPITVPAGVEVKIEEGNVVTVKGPKGTLTRTLHKDMIINNKNAGVITIELKDESQNALQGLTRTLLNNMIVGVTEGFKKELEINGVGYRVQKQGNKLVMNMGFSHTVEFEDRGDTKIEAPSQTSIIVTGPDKEAVGQLAAEIRKVRPPEPYKGKGIKYIDERIIRKEGKMGKK
ncbi:MAG: 50S ribosomal protein L6 [Clostridia bacterium]|nr:50S ribosomal protein L6 [Clostridia bacterium]